MTDTDGEADPAPDGQKADQAAQEGLAFLRLLAEAADPKAPDWVNRRVQQLEFLDTRAVQWRVSIDFNVPDDAPVITVGPERFRLVPVTPWEKANLVAFDLRDEGGNTMWLPNTERTTRQLSAGLTQWAKSILSQSAAGTGRRVPFPAELSTLLEEIVFRQPPEWAKNTDPFDGIATLNGSAGGSAAGSGAVTATKLQDAIDRLRANVPFMSRLQELWQNNLIVAAVADSPGARRVIKLSFESEVTFRRPTARSLRLLQSLGWRAWRLDVFIGGRGGSHHLEVTAPTGIDIVRISAQPAVPDQAGGTFTAQGGAPHVHIEVPVRDRGRYRATIRLRVSRPGWLTTTWMAGLVIAVVMVVGRIDLAVLYSTSPGTAMGESGTAATLLLALLAVFGTVLFGPGGHPLASRLLRAARFLILVDSAAILACTGSLLLHTSQSSPPALLWSVLAGVSAVIAALLTVSMLFPGGPRRTEGQRARVLALVTSMTSVVGNVLTRAIPGNFLTWVRRMRGGKPGRRLGEDVVTIPSADGYSFADNHPWGPDDHADLVRELRQAERVNRRRSRGRKTATQASVAGESHAEGRR
jgi:hypothetical protein